MLRRYEHLRVKHLQPYADQLIIPDTADFWGTKLVTLLTESWSLGRAKSLKRLVDAPRLELGNR